MTIWHFIIAMLAMVSSVLIAAAFEHERCSLERRIGGAVSNSTSGVIVRKACLIYMAFAVLTSYIW